jgi:acyl carrier protein
MEEIDLKDTQHLAPEEAILAYMKRHLGAVVGDPGLLHTDITMDTTFGGDLELESIEFVALAERLRTEFGERVNFVAFLAKKHVNDMVSLTVGDVVRYVVSCLQEGSQSMPELQAHG